MSENDFNRIYLDYAATTPVRKEVLDKMMPFYTTSFGNASAIYKSAQAAKNAIENSRNIIANLLHVKPREIYFTSGGTESNNWALLGTFCAKKNAKNKLITSQYEHHSILNTADYIGQIGGHCEYLKIQTNGQIDIEQLKNTIDDNTFLVSIMLANNELGSLNQVNEIADICHSKNILFHTDAVAAAGHLDIDAKKYDLLSISAHKFYGPKGVGVLYIREGTKIKPLLYGGEQESGKRAGTENVAAIVGCATALQLACLELESENQRILKLRNEFEEKLKHAIKDIKINNDFDERLPNYSNISLPNINSQTALIFLDLNGIECSSGSACMSGGSMPSHVLRAMNIPDWQVKNALRFTFGKHTTQLQINKTVEELVKLCKTAQ